MFTKFKIYIESCLDCPCMQDCPHICMTNTNPCIQRRLDLYIKKQNEQKQKKAKYMKEYRNDNRD